MAAITSTGTEPLDQDFYDKACTPDTQRQAGYTIYQEYYEGFDPKRDRAPRLTDRARRYLERSGFPFNENFCEPVIDVFSERLGVTGFSTEDSAGDDDTPTTDAQKSDMMVQLEEWLDKVWERNRMDSKQTAVHTTTLLKGDAYVIVDWNEDTLLPRLSFNRPETIPTVCYDTEDPDVIMWAAKCWNTDSESFSNPECKAIGRMNVYYPDRVEKLYRLQADDKKGGWERFLQTEGDPWPTPWVRGDGEPRGVPVIHFRHKHMGHDYGRFELHGTVPFQDELNKAVIDLNAIMDYQAWPQRFVTGVASDNVDLKPEPGVFLHADDPAVTFGQLPPADLSGALAAIEGCLSRLARRSRTPMHLLTGGTPPSGEALKTAESGLLSKVELAQTPFGNAWEDVMMMAIRLAVDAGQTPVAGLDDSNLVIETAWKDAATRNDFLEAQTLEILDGLGVSQHTIFTRAGLSWDEEMEWKAQEKATLDEASVGLLDATVPQPVAALPGQGDPAGLPAGTPEPVYPQLLRRDRLFKPAPAARPPSAPAPGR